MLTELIEKCFFNWPILILRAYDPKDPEKRTK